jgi:lipopolysaccharide transport system permease protein
VTYRVSESRQWTENRPSLGRRTLRLGELWRYRELVAFLALRDIKVRYKQAVLGGAWAVLQPLLSAAIFTVVFGRLARVSSGDVPYLVFSFAGVTLWSYLNTAVNKARSSLVSNSALITKVYFPRLAAPFASVVPGLIDLAVTLPVVVAMMVWSGVTPTARIFVAPLFLGGTMLVALGTGTLFAALTVQYRDVEQVFGLLLQMWLFATPVAYPTELIPDRWQWVYHLNPMVGLVDGWRWSLLGGAALGPEAIVSCVTAAAVLVTGLRVFQRAERRFADII